MRRAEPVKVPLFPLEEIRRTLEDRDRPRRVPAATQPRDEGGRELVDEATIQALREAPQEPVRVPLDEIRRTMYDLDRQHAEERAHRGEGNRPRKASEPQPRGAKVILPAKEVARTLSDLDRQHAEEMTRRRRVARARPQEAMELESEFRNANLRVPLKEVTRTLDDLERQHTQETARRRQGALLQTAMEPQLRDGKLRVPPEEIVRISDSLDREHAEHGASRPRLAHQARRGRQCPQEPGATELLERPTTPEPTFPPQTPPSRKRRSAQQGLLTPPPSGQRHPRKRPRLLHETVQLQQRSIDAILQHRESCFRAKKDTSVGRSWCKEVPLALQVETSKSFYEAFTDERTLPISRCTFCYRKCPPAKITTIHWRTYLTPALLQATTALQKCKKCLPQDGDMGVDICLECRGVFEKGKLPKACSVNNMDIGCEHRYPRELDGLSPVEERLIALQAPFGYITKFTVDNKTPSGMT
ncbi:hypothetical protein BKA56DRAFT_708170 [Ilyonectria sp. MPI-CAGE-AT-0026]|nr:hypothetical protein BKA56DRAFT_625736 [Ilyonectria sp. MPI-CAGE-AT-0026]KAH6952512.1 hypothetical protein BKA56DRAFT_625623 [Ilyonectria sp. MPI-CAGE-AT-0026]KAH6953685.1 hypothetical protein BKA56DRAFT_708170 [Ilyonectria sp. MPI-CAGE-AT-0026]